MSAQRYSNFNAHQRMFNNLCPECGQPADAHVDDVRFWIPRDCDLLPRGVTERIAQYQEDRGT